MRVKLISIITSILFLQNSLVHGSNEYVRALSFGDDLFNSHPDLNVARLRDPPDLPAGMKDITWCVSATFHIIYSQSMFSSVKSFRYVWG